MPTDERNIETLIKALPENLREEAIDFIDYLLSKSRAERLDRQKETESFEKLDPAKDPLLKLVGIADVEPFADHIDDELYGRRNKSLH